MTTKQEVDRIIEIAPELDPPAVAAEVSLLTGARLKSQALDTSGGSRSAEHGLPLPDRVDRWVTRKSKAYRKDIKAACDALERALFTQSELLVRLHDGHGNPTDEARALAAEAVSPQAVSCANCGRVVERTANDKLLGGRCRPCYDYLKRWLVERPRELWANTSGAGAKVAA